MQQLFEISERLVNTVNTKFYRGLYSRMDANLRLTEIRGARGTGKTTMMLQKAKQISESGKKVLYISADIPYFYKNSLFDTADTFYKYGGEYLFVDEVHKYPSKHKQNDWSREIKNIYDAFPSLKMVYSGSSILEMHQGQGDLSRRKVSYSLQGLSLREYLQLYHQIDIPSFSLDQIITDHQKLSRLVSDKIKILPVFNQYLKTGYYPFFMESMENYYPRISEVIGVVIDSDIPSVSDVSNESLHKIKQLLAAVATTVPYTPHLSNLASELYIADQRTLIKYLNLLEKADLINTLGAKVVGNKILNKPLKIYLNNTNLMFAIDLKNTQTGTLRETFFYNQVGYAHRVSYPQKGDFMVDDRYTVEVGGKNKTNKQVTGIEAAYIASDEIEVGFGNRIPLWLLGFLY
ncbi:AAA family ATPase [Geofilum rubicundum]|uniref:ATPase n=1 Tax=Geofilum rubicundum JCM 15548 TaxID=1236989 RepID=A0A0E9M336_9BACT|nr:AAA family ATPase [Geofilum rubicundum]GAO31883.1 ATPase [Geofilum rubicundum JCM 15548]